MYCTNQFSPTGQYKSKNVLPPKDTLSDAVAYLETWAANRKWQIFGEVDAENDAYDAMVFMPDGRAIQFEISAT